MIYRVTFGFAGGNEGWSETHLMQSQDTSIDAFQALVLTVVQARANLLGTPYFVNAYRIAAYSDDAGNKVPRAVRLYKGNWGPVGGFAANTAEPAVVALQAVGVTGGLIGDRAQFNGNKTTTFLGGPPDDAVDNAGVVFPARAGLAAAFDAYKQALKNRGFGWGASQTDLNAAVKTIAQNPDGTVKITMTANVVPQLTLNAYYPARVRDVNNGHSPLNGQLIVKVSGADEFTTKEIIGIPTAQLNGFVRVYHPIRPFLPYTNLTLGLRTVKHKRGKPFGSLPGRAKARVRG
jgi:hypothetical protein